MNRDLKLFNIDGLLVHSFVYNPVAITDLVSLMLTEHNSLCTAIFFPVTMAVLTRGEHMLRCD